MTLFASEVGVQIAIAEGGLRGYLVKDRMHILDMLILLTSILFSVYFLVSGGGSEGLYGAAEAIRDGLRIVRTLAFVWRLLQLLRRPLDHFAMFAEELVHQNEGVI